MLSDHEQRVWDDIERFYADEAEEPVRPGRRPFGQRKQQVGAMEDMPAAAVAGVWATIMLVLFGAVVAGLAVGGATALGWLLWRYWPHLGHAAAAVSTLPVDGEAGGAGGAGRGSADTPERPRRRRSPQAD